MKQEASKKSKKWIWLVAGIVALLAVVGVVLGIVLSGGTDGPEGPTGGRPDLYWNVDRELYLDETGLSTRKPESDGKFHITFAHDGEQVELIATEKKLVNKIDSDDACGLVFDENGVIVDVLSAKEIATEVAKRFYVVKVEGNVLTLNSGINMDGISKQITCTEETTIYDLSGQSDFKGQEAELSMFQPMDTATVYSNDLGEITHVGLMKTPVSTPVYWRANFSQMYSWGDASTTRVPNENGEYEIEFFANGERVTLKSKDKDVITKIDKAEGYACHFGLVFDEDGYIVGTQSSQLGIRGILGCSVFDITEIEGNTFTAKCLVGTSQDIGKTYTNTYTDNTVIYDVSQVPMEEERGQITDYLQVGDRLTVFENTLGEPMLIFVSTRIVPGPIYYNYDRKWDKTTETTTREPDAQGWYYIDLYVDGELKTFKTKDVKQMNIADGQGNYCIGLQLDGDVIIRAYPSMCVTGGDSRFDWLISDITGILVTIAQPGGTITTTRLQSIDCKIFDMTGYKAPLGTPTTLKQGDRATTLFNANGELVYAFVRTRRVEGAEIYYNMERKYDNTNKVSTREPDADGWYVYKMAKDGKVVYVKTKSAAMATKIDKQYYPVLALEVNSSGIVQNAYPAAASTGGGTTYPYWVFDGYDEEGKIAVIPSDPTDTRREFMNPSEDYQVIHLAEVGYNNYRGEHGKLQKGDRILGLTNDKNKTIIVYIFERNSIYKPFTLRVDTKYDRVNKVTTREPDADGWYYIQVAEEGTLKTYKTKDKAIMSQVDGSAYAFSLWAPKDNIILGVIPLMNITNVDISGPNGEVTKISGRSVTIKLADGEKTYTMASDCKYFDTSSTAEQFGMKTTLRVGDMVRTYQKSDEELSFMVVQSRYFPRVKGQTGYCEHCNKTVEWKDWNRDRVNGVGGHFYLGADNKITSLSIIKGTDGPIDVVLDLNGNDIIHTGNQRVFLIQEGASLSIMDSVGGGKITAKGMTGAIGGMVLASGGSSFNVYGGEIELLKDNNQPVKGGIIHTINANVNIYGGKLTAPTLDDGTGAIYLTPGNLTMSGGTVSGSEIAVRGGCTAKLSGKINIEYLNVAKGILLDCTGLDAKSSIGIIGGGKFTNDLANPSAYLKTFKPLQEGASIVVQGNALAYKEVQPELENVYEAAKDMNFSNANKLPTSCPACGKTSGVTWTKLTKEMIDASNAEKTPGLPGGHYYLAGDLNLGDSHITGGSSDGQTLCLHLNGKTLSGGNGNGVLSLRAVTMNVMGNGTVIGGASASRVFNPNGGTFNVCGGTYKVSTANARVVWANGTGTVNLYDGTIDGSDGLYAVYLVRGGAFNMMGGTVTGGRIYSDVATDNILTNTIRIKAGTVAGGIGARRCEVEISGGKVSFVDIVEEATVTLSGKPVISLLNLPEGMKAKVGALQTGAEIKVKATGVFTEDFATTAAAEAALAYITAQESGKEVKVNGKALECVGGSGGGNVESVYEQAIAMDFSDPNNLPDYCPACGASFGVTWKPLTNAAGQQLQGHYYVPEGGVELGGNTDSHITGGTANGQTLCLHLNNSTITGGGHNGIFSLRQMTMNIMGDGTVTGGASASRVFNTNAGTFNIYGGTYATTKEATRVVVSQQANGTLNLYEGTITGVSDGFAVYLNNGAIFNMEGGTIAGSRLYSDNQGVANTVNITGGTISGGVGLAQCNATVSGGTINAVEVGTGTALTVSGTPKIAFLNVGNGIKVAVGELETGAEITVKANGVFTEDFADADAAEAAMAFFAAYDPDNKKLEVSDKALAYVSIAGGGSEPPQPGPTLSIYEQAKAMDFSDANNLPTYCPACGATEGVTWTALASDIGSAQIQGHYYLADETVDIGVNHLTVGTANGQTLCVNLNGKTLTGGNGNGIFSMRQCVLNVMGDGTVTGGSSAGRVFNTNAGTINLYGGTYGVTTGRTVWSNGAGTVTLHEGTINGLSDAFAVYLNNGATFVMNGGTVTGARLYSDDQAGVANNITINGGTVAHLGTKLCNLTVAGGTINTLDVGEGTAATLSGKPVINAMNVADDIKVTVGALEAGAQIAVKANGAFTEDFADTAAAINALTYFSAVDAENKKIEVAGKALACVDKPAEPTNSIYEQAKAMDFTTSQVHDCPACGAEGVTWTALASDIGSAQIQGHYYLADETVDIGVNHITVGTTNGQTLCVNLNGKTLTGGNGNGIFSMRQCVLNVMGDGTVTGGSSAGRVFNTNAGTINLYGGTYGVTTGRTVWSNGAGTVTLHEGTIDGTNGAFAVYLNNGASFVMNGGTVTGARLYSDDQAGVTNNITINDGTVAHLGASKCNLTVTGGTINQIDVSADSTVTLSGKPTIALMNLPEDYKITVGTLETDANITVKASGVFTEAFVDLSAAEAAQANFHPYDAENREITIVENALAYTEKAAAPLSIYQQAVAMDFSDANNLPTYCPACGATEGVTWTALTSAAGGQQLKGHYYLADETVDIGGNHITVGTANGQTLCVNLNGKTLTGGNDNGIFSMRTCVLNVMGTGTVTGGASAGRVFNTNGGTINLYGGTYGVTTGRTVWSQGAGTVTLHEGTIDGTNGAFAVYLNKGATFIMNGGTVTGGRVYTDNNGSTDVNTVTINGGTVAHIGTTLCNLTVTGGTINQIDVSADSTVTLSGKPSIAQMNLPEDYKLIANGLESGASIKVKATGVFTENFADETAAEAAKDYFLPEDGKVISRKELALSSDEEEPAA